MENKVRDYVNNLFKAFEQDEKTLDTKEELTLNLLDRINDSIDLGMSENDAFNKAIGNLGTKSELKKIFNFKYLERMSFNYTLNNTYAVIAAIVYLVLGSIFDLWHPGWIVFVLAIVFSEFKLNDKKSYFIPALSLIYLAIGLLWNYWHPGWIIFPIGFVVLATIEKKFEVMLLIVSGIYLILGILFGYWLLFSIIFILAGGLVLGRDEITSGLWIFTIAVYIFLGFMFDLWHPGWLVFLVTGAITTIIEEKSFVGFTWIISIAVYLFLGFVFTLWHPSWIIFVLAAAVSTYIGDENENKVFGVEIKENEVS